MLLVSVFTNDGFISLSSGNTLLRILLRLNTLPALVLSSRQPAPAAVIHSVISLRVIPSRGRMSTTSGAPGTVPRACIPRRPRPPVPLSRFRNSVSALSSALCATATQLKPRSRHSSANQAYRCSRAAISMLIPFSTAYFEVSNRLPMNSTPLRAYQSRTKASSPSLSAPRSPKLQCATAMAPAPSVARNRSAINIESMPPLTASRIFIYLRGLNV